MITLFKLCFAVYKVIFQLVLIVASSYFVILKYLFVFVNDILKIELDKKGKEVKENESKSNKKRSS